MPYNPQSIEPIWQTNWAKHDSFWAEIDPTMLWTERDFELSLGFEAEVVSAQLDLWHRTARVDCPG